MTIISGMTPTQSRNSQRQPSSILKSARKGDKKKRPMTAERRSGNYNHIKRQAPQGVNYSPYPVQNAAQLPSKKSSMKRQVSFHSKKNQQLPANLNEGMGYLKEL